MKWKLAVSIFLVILVAGFFILKYYSGNLLNIPQSSNQSSQVPQAITTANVDNSLNQTGAVIDQGMDQLDKDLQSVGAIAPEEDPNSL